MKKDAHYYAVFAFCRACGFTKDSAHTITYASQFVDDAKINLIFFKNSSDIKHDIIQNRPAFFNMATCHSYFRINTFNYEAMVNNTCAFHFVPGCEGKTFSQRLRCKEESPVILDILNDILPEDNLIKLGIALHAYADTFSHQGFSGMLSQVNAIINCEAKTEVFLGIFDRMTDILDILRYFGKDKFETYFDRFMPAYGHSQARDFPDIPYLSWFYEYDFSDEFHGSYQGIRINNQERYRRAFKGIKRYLEEYLTRHKQYRDQSIKFTNFEPLIQALTTKSNEKMRQKNWRKVFVDQGLLNSTDQGFLHYDEIKWLKGAFKNFNNKVFDHRVVEGAQLADDFSNSNWYSFYLAVKWYKKKFFEYCVKYQLDIPH